MQGCKMKIYLDNGATTMTAKEVVDEMNVYFTEKYGNASSLHSFGEEAKKALNNSREIIAKKINAEPKEIIFTSGGSESDNLALKGVAFALRKKGNHIITTSIEHPAILGTCNFLSKHGFEITYLKVDNEGFIDLDELEKSLTDKTVLVTIMHANNEIGTIQDLARIGAICKKHNVLFHTDAVQSFTKTDIDVKRMNIDLASFSGHKIHGPKGIGALYVRKGIKLDKMIHGGHHEFDKRAGTENISGIAGFAKAVEISNQADVKKMTELREYFITEIIKNIKDVKLNGPEGEKRLCNNVNVSFRYIEGESILFHLDMKGIAVSTGSACSSQNLEPSHVLLAIGLPHEIAHGTIRFT
ncbi:cysteine desulfurase, partial [Candidatus Woesearchaeota archaeon]|nr:cysteine desulfurase [Candidatus Woesearchaeota archaeon]